MCRLLETIKIQDGEFRNMEFHNRRFNAGRLEIFGVETGQELNSLIEIPADLEKGVYRCRVIYGEEIEKIEFIRHIPKAFRSLKLVYRDDIDYSLKYADRTLLMSLLKEREKCDEILIVKNGFISDTSISNIALRQKDGSWVTPDTPLLKGTMRMYLLETGQITEASIRPEDLKNFSEARMINCMMDLASSRGIEMQNIIR